MVFNAKLKVSSVVSALKFNTKNFLEQQEPKMPSQCITPSEGFSHHSEVLIMVSTMPVLSGYKKI